VRLPNWVGDVIMATPALRALRAAFPAAEMTLVGPGSARGLLSGASWCQRYETSVASAGSVDAAVLLPHSFTTAWEAWRAGIPARAGFRGELRGGLLTHGVTAIRGNRRTEPYSKITYLRRLLEGLGIPLDDLRLELPLDADAERRVDDVLREVEIDPSRPFVVLNPGGAWGPTKLWPEEHFARAGDLASERLGAQVLLISGPGEEDAARRIASSTRVRASVLGPAAGTFPVVKSVVRRALAMISNDSGPRHIAACFDVPCVVLVGPFHPVISDNAHLRTAMLWEGVECSPCHLKTCPIDHRCMTRLTPENVVAVAERLIRSKAGRA